MLRPPAFVVAGTNPGGPRGVRSEVANMPGFVRAPGAPMELRRCFVAKLRRWRGYAAALTASFCVLVPVSPGSSATFIV